MKRKITILAGAMLAIAAQAEVKLDVLEYNRFQAVWNGKTVISPSEPGLAKSAGGVMEFFDPTTRQINKVNVSQEAAALRVLNKQRQRVSLGKPTLTVEKKDGAITYLEKYPNADACWKVVMTPVEDNALDIRVEISVNSNYWLEGFNFDLFKVAVSNATADSGQLRSRINKQNREKFPPPITGPVTIVYPHGPEAYVPAAVFQGDELAFGIAQLDVHNTWRHDVNRLEMTPNNKRTSYIVTLQSGWANTSSFANFYKHTFNARYRMRFAEPRPAGEAGYLTMVDGKDLWIDYMKELDENMPNSKQPQFDINKNNIVICHYFTSEEMYITSENPMGYLMMSPNWKDDKWEWGYEKINSAMSNEEIKKRTGLGDENAGAPIKWVKPMAERLVREALEIKAQAVIVMKSGTHPQQGELNYIPESHLFHPSLEERATVDSPVREWDWVRGDIKIFDPQGNLIGEDNNVAIQAADKELLIPFNRGNRSRQELFIHESKVNANFDKYRGKFDIGPKNIYTLKNVAGFEVVTPQKNLMGKKTGDTASVTFFPISWNPEVREKPFKAEIKITSVERAAIDIWAKTMTDAGIELGFLVREDITAGPPWKQFDYSFDFGNDWQYQVIKQRVQWNRARFGEKCRWFYFDVFGDWTPSFVFAMLRSEYPDCFFFVEHPNDVAERVVNGWKWFGEKTELEKYVAPASLSTVVFERLLTYNQDKDKLMIKKFFNQPGYMLNVHRGGRRIIELARDSK